MALRRLQVEIPTLHMVSYLKRCFVYCIHSNPKIGGYAAYVQYYQQYMAAAAAAQQQNPSGPPGSAPPPPPSENPPPPPPSGAPSGTGSYGNVSVLDGVDNHSF